MKLDRKALIKRCDKLRQTLARYEGARKKQGVWYNTCVTCGKVVRCDKGQGGHFVGRACLPLRWDKRNVHCQCVRCNLYRSGAYLEYSQWFIKEYGQKLFDIYIDKYKDWQTGKIPPLKIGEIRDIYDELLKEGRELEKKVGSLFPKSWVSFGPDFIEQSP